MAEISENEFYEGYTAYCSALDKLPPNLRRYCPLYHVFTAFEMRGRLYALSGQWTVQLSDEAAERVRWIRGPNVETLLRAYAIQKQNQECEK